MLYSFSFISAVPRLVLGTQQSSKLTVQGAGVGLGHKCKKRQFFPIVDFHVLSKALVFNVCFTCMVRTGRFGEPCVQIPVPAV